MRWETAASTSNNEVYHLYKEDKKILTVILNPFSNAARVECEKQKRVFLIRKEGFRRNKTVLRDEYGFKIGELGQERNENFIDVNNERFFYSTHNNPLAQLVLYNATPWFADGTLLVYVPAGNKGECSSIFFLMNL